MRTAVLVLAVSVAIAVGIGRWQAPSQASAPSSGLANQLSVSAQLDDEVGDVTPASEAGDDGTAAAISTLPVQSVDAPAEVVQVAQPSRVMVPSLDLDVDIVPVGVDDEGLFDVPSADQVGWYRYGPAPGDPGSAVLAAHVDYNGSLGAFFDLKHLVPGDLVHLEYEDGSAQSFEVIDQTLYEKTALPAAELFRRDGDSVLHLATCGGSFDPVSRSYLGNRVVTAIPVNELPELGNAG